MIVVGVYIDLNKSADCREIEYGNPGIGGTQYQMLLMSYHLATTYADRYKVVVFCQHPLTFSVSGIQQVIISPDDLPKALVSAKLDLLILRSDLDTLKSIEQVDVKVICWGHNFYYAALANIITAQKNIKANVFVGKQMYDCYLDDDVIDKSVVIWNMVPSVLDIPKRQESYNVVYIGALIPSKGFDVLASIWKKIVSRVPQAQLYVLGGGDLYGKQGYVSGRYGLAEKSFEHRFMRHLCDKEGNILPSVHFEGVVHSQKEKYFKSAAVGCINPSARTETFGLGIVELNTYGCPVVTLNKNGFPDVICNNRTGFLCANKNKIAKKIIYLLKNRDENVRMGNEAYLFSKQFAPELIMPKWITLLDAVYNDRFKGVFESPSRPFNNNFKWVRMVIRFIRCTLGLSFFPSMIQQLSWLLSIKRKLMH